MKGKPGADLTLPPSGLKKLTDPALTPGTGSVYCADGETEVQGGGSLSLVDNLTTSRLLTKFPIVFPCVSEFIGSASQQMLIFSCRHLLSLPFSCHP